MGIVNNAAGAARFQGLMTGVSMTIVSIILGVVLVGIGVFNVNNKQDPNFTKGVATLSKPFVPYSNMTDTDQDAFWSDATKCTKPALKFGQKVCKKYKYGTVEYTNSNCGAPMYSQFTGAAASSQPKSLKNIEYNKETGECRTPKMTKQESVTFLIIGVVLVLLGLSMGYCTSSETCRGILGIFSFMSSTSSRRNNNNNYQW